MKHLRWALVAAGSLLALAAGPGAMRPAAAQDYSGVNWLSDKKKAFEEARKTGKPLWVLFR